MLLIKHDVQRVSGQLLNTMPAVRKIYSLLLNIPLAKLIKTHIVLQLLMKSTEMQTLGAL